MALDMPELSARARTIRLLVLDVDGVLTDGRIQLDADGREMKTFHVHDGFGLRQLMKAGYEIAVISGRKSAAVEARMQDLGITRLYLGRGDKQTAMNELLAETGFQRDEVAVVGDDAPDIPLFETAGLTFTVPDAPAEIRTAVDAVTERRGGHGAVREVCDLLLASRD